MENIVDRKSYRTVVISDVHLGTRYSKVSQVSDFLASVDCESLILNGDTIDGWQLQKNNYQYWGPEQARFFRIIMKMVEKHGTQVYFLRGNHDDFLDRIIPMQMGPLSIQKDMVIESAVKKYAVEHNIPVLQPLSLKDPEFLEALKAWKADMFVVVAFRMLPKGVWEMPRLGTFNLHAALLPQYRGAAPINWAVINGDKATGVTTFMIDEGMDTGGIMFREQCLIGPDENVGQVHDKLMEIGSGLVVQTVDAILDNNVETRVQKSFVQGSEILRPAPKLSRELMHIDWNVKTKYAYNLIRGLSPYPAAFTELTKDDKVLQMKIYAAAKVLGDEYKAMLEQNGLETAAPGTVLSDGRTYLAISTADGAISVTELQLAGKKRMSVKDFLIGFREPQTYGTTQGTSSKITGHHA